MGNTIQNIKDKYSDIFYALIFGIVFILSLNTYSEDSSESFFWLLIMLVCFFLSIYYLTSILSKFMDKFESISLFRDINKPLKPSTFFLVYMTVLFLTVSVSWINSTSVENFSDNFAEGLFIIQIVLLFAITNDLSHYLSRASTAKTVAYGDEDVFQRTENGIAIEETKGFFKKNLRILINILNFCLFLFSFSLFP